MRQALLSRNAKSFSSSKNMTCNHGALFIEVPEEPRRQIRENVSPTNSKVPSNSDLSRVTDFSKKLAALSSDPERS